ncbi:MAG: GTPase HflX [bacterium TMED264]|nr:MAG: GTPase HflX [bacterium TMED264]
MDNKISDQENVLLVGVISKINNQSIVEEHLQELCLLVKTAGAKVVGMVTQKVSKINPVTLIGVGKAKQIISQAKEIGAKIIIFDDELSPAQIKNYHKMSKSIKILDRNGLILDIFKKHARTKEAITQVDLAYLEYLLPRLTRQWTHLERQMGGIGTRAGMGETQIEIDRRLIRTRINRLKKELKKIEKERGTQSLNRKSEYRVSLVGYTNAGKSTLFKALTGADVFIKNQLFATLDTTIRKLTLDSSHKVLLSDTVGFIRKLPHNLVASFRSTLKEVLEADLIVIVLDISSTEIDDHLDTINNVLFDMGANKVPVLHVLNKVDKILDNKKVEKIKRSFVNSVIISAQHHLMISELKNKIVEKMESNFQTVELKIPYKDGKLIANAHQGVKVLETNFEDDIIKLKVRGAKPRIKQIINNMS